MVQWLLHQTAPSHRRTMQFRKAKKNSNVKLFRLCNFNLVLVHNIEFDFGRQLAFTPKWHPNTHSHTYFESDQHRCHHIQRFICISSRCSCTMHISHNAQAHCQWHFFGCFRKLFQSHNKSDLITVVVEWLFSYFRDSIRAYRRTTMYICSAKDMQWKLRERERYRVSNLP